MNPAAALEIEGLVLLVDRDAAVAALTDIVRAEPESADEVFLVAQDDEGHVGETIYGSSLHVTA